MVLKLMEDTHTVVVEIALEGLALVVPLTMQRAQVLLYKIVLLMARMAIVAHRWWLLVERFLSQH